jgi:hypothetical protein
VDLRRRGPPQRVSPRRQARTYTAGLSANGQPAGTAIMPNEGAVAVAPGCGVQDRAGTQSAWSAGKAVQPGADGLKAEFLDPLA